MKLGSFVGLYFLGIEFVNWNSKRTTMKNLSIILFSLVTLISAQIYAQSSAGIFYISFRMDEELMNDLSVSFNDRNFLSGYSEKPAFPESLIDSVKLSIESTVSEALKSKAACIYKLNKKGNNVTTLGMNGELEGMPVDTKKNAMKMNEKNYYVRVDINVTGKGGVSVTLPDGKRSKLKPAISLNISAFDELGNKVYDEKSKLSEFGVLKAREDSSADGSVTVRKAEILYPEDIYQMLNQVSAQFLLEHVDSNE